MHYLIWVDDEMQQGEVGPTEQAFVTEVVAPALQAMTEDEYKYGPAGILQTMARFSYVLWGDDVLWCVEWDPSLLVVRFSPDGSIAWAAIDSELGDEPERAEDPRYKLVFDAWDAQLDVQQREWGGFVAAAADPQARWERAMATVNRITEALQAEFGNDDAAFEAWQARCESSPLWGEVE